MTKQKRIILEIINTSMIHLTAEEIYSEAKKQIPSISLGTVYRNLGVLTDDLIIKKIKTQGKFIYDKSLKPHGHIVCPICGKVTDYNSKDVTEILNRDFKNKLESYDLIIKVKCDNCQNKGEE